MKHWRLNLWLILFVLLFSVPVFATTDLVDVLLLNSYHDGYLWSDETRQGVNDILESEVNDYYVRIEHMDTKNISTDEYLEELYSLYKIKYDPDEFDVIISADDNALKFLLKYKEELFGQTPVFFCGVNSLDAHDLENREGFYGVVEKHSIKDTVELAKAQNPNLKYVYLAIDNSVTGQSSKVDAIKDMETYHPELELVVLEDMYYQEILDTISQLSIGDSIVLQTFYVVDKDNTIYPLEYTARQMIEYSSVPIYGLFSFSFGEGSVGGKFVEGYTQGSRAAMMVLDYLEDGSLEGDRFVVDDSYNRYMFDYNVMKTYDMDLDLLPEGSIIINQPVTFYDKHGRVINFGLVIVLLLMIYVLILRLQIAKQTKKVIQANKHIMESEKMASLGKLVAGVAHEINTPIGIGVSLASYMETQAQTIASEMAEEQLTKTKLETYLMDQQTNSDLMLKTMKRASELVQSFKQVAVDQTADEEREFEIGSYVEEIINSLRSELKKKVVKVKVHYKEEIWIKGHSGAIYQILLNLITNSLLHGFEDRDHGAITIKIEKLNTSDARVKLVYCDDGKGISDNHLDRIYEPFYTSKRSEGGSGLGMYIINNLIEQRLDGTIICDTNVGVGTTFTIEFPVTLVK